MKKSLNISLIKYNPKSKDYVFGTTRKELNWMEKLTYDVSREHVLKSEGIENYGVIAFNLLVEKFPVNDFAFDVEYESTKERLTVLTQTLYELINASTRELMRRLTIYASQLTTVKLSVLRNTRIHSLSIFFGLCCSSSGYIFDAITGASSYPCPVK